MKRLLSMLFLFSLLAMPVIAAAQEKHYEGDITSVDAKARTFTVRATVRGEPVEMEFHVDKASEISIEGERKMFAELERGDHVTVTYETSGMTHMARNVTRHKTMAKEMKFDGQIVNIDTKAHTFTVRGTAKGKTEEMMFHLSPSARIYIGATHESLIQQLQIGDEVTVHYETMAGVHTVRAVGRHKKAS
jgi:ribosomal protein L19